MTASADPPVFGVDEAGKGPAVGAMFAAAVVAPTGALPDGVADSKALTAERRERLAAELRADPSVTACVASVPPGRIDAPETDMNGLTVRVQAAALRGVLERCGVDPTDLAGTLDAGDVDAGRFGRRVAERVPDGLAIDARHGADEDDPAVAAASVLAKVERDAHVAALGERYGDGTVESDDAAIGSGYPHDRATRTFLEEYVAANGALPACARASWATCREIVAEAEQSGLGEF